MTRGIEDYLKAIFYINQQGNKVNNKSISERLNISAPSVSEMLKKIEDIGYVTLEKREVKLTKEGYKLAFKMMRKHKVWEEFLIKKLGYNKNDVHKEAENLEHATSDELLETLENFLGYKYHLNDEDYQ